MNILQAVFTPGDSKKHKRQEIKGAMILAQTKLAQAKVSQQTFSKAKDSQVQKIPKYER
jgi:hypothetical protein